MTELWQEWQTNKVEADVFNVNVPLGFKTVDGTPVSPEILRTTVDMQSQYSSLYSKHLAPFLASYLLHVQLSSDYRLCFCCTLCVLCSATESGDTVAGHCCAA